MKHSDPVLSWPGAVKIPVLANLAAWAGLWMSQVLIHGMISLVHVTLALILLVVFTTRARMAWVACLAYNTLIVVSKGHDMLSKGALEFKAAIVLDSCVVIGFLVAIMLLMRPEVMRFFLSPRNPLTPSDSTFTKRD